MKIIVDNGGTKSDWAIVENDQRFSSAGINVFDENENIVSAIREVLSKDILKSKNLSIDFYTAGLTYESEKKLTQIFDEYFNNIRVSFFSDMLCASRALFHHSEGVACILGTGSNCAYFDGAKNHQISPSLGYLFGDEGSGYDLGKQFLIKYFHNKLDTGLHKAFEEETNMNQDELISSIYSSKNKKFDIAHFSFFLKKHESNNQIREIIYNSIFNFLTKYAFNGIMSKESPDYKDIVDYQIGFVGSVAFNFRNIIDEIMLKHGLNYIVIEKPMDRLINFYRP